MTARFPSFGACTYRGPRLVTSRHEVERCRALDHATHRGALSSGAFRSGAGSGRAGWPLTNPGLCSPSSSARGGIKIDTDDSVSARPSLAAFKPTSTARTCVAAPAAGMVSVRTFVIFGIGGLALLAMPTGAGVGREDMASQADGSCGWGVGANCRCVDRSINLALGASVDSPDELEQDWCVDARTGCSDAWAADGRHDTYWDEEDGKEQYRLRLRLAADGTHSPARKLAGLAIIGFSHHRFSPRSFLVVCDTPDDERVELFHTANAVYAENRWEGCFEPQECVSVEIFITESYGGSPAIREVMLFPPAPVQPEDAAPRAVREGAAGVEQEGGSGTRCARQELLLPQNIGRSSCGHLAGMTLVCLGEGGDADECGAKRLKHWECVRDDSSRGRQGLSGHRSLNRLVEYRYGYLLYNPFDVYFAVAIELYGEWSELEMRLMRRFLRAGDTVVEAGVHIGSLTVAFAQLVGVTGRVIGFEPQRVLYQMAAANVAINGLWNVHLHNVGAGNTSDPAIRLPIVQYEPNAFRNFGGVRLGEIAEQIEASVEYVGIRRVDELELSACDFLKIDTEGFEEAVLAGARQTLAAFKPTVYFEDNQHGAAGSRCPDAALPLASELGYVCYKHVTPYFNPDNYRNEPLDYFSGTSGPSLSYMVLCVHPERPSAGDQLPGLQGDFASLELLECA